MAADKYKSKFVTKPTHLPRPVYCKITQHKLTTTTDSSTPIQADTASKTKLTLATSSEIRDAIEALLMLGEVPITNKTQLQDDDNALLVLITGSGLPHENYVPTEPTGPIEESLQEITVTQTVEPTD